MDDFLPKTMNTAEETRLKGKKNASKADLAELNLDRFQYMLEDLREYYVAGMEQQLYFVMKETDWTRDKVLESLILKGSFHGFSGFEFEKADPSDLENWMNGVKSINDVLTYVGHLRGQDKEENGKPFEYSVTQDE